SYLSSAHHHHTSASLQHLPHPLFPLLHIYRHVCSSALHHSHHSHHLPYSPFHHHCHSFLSSYSSPPQFPPQLLRSPHQLPITHPLSSSAYSYRISYLSCFPPYLLFHRLAFSLFLPRV